MQNQSLPQLIVNDVAVHAVLDTQSSTGLVALLRNANLLALLNGSDRVILSDKTAGFLKNNALNTAISFGNTLSALSYLVLNDPNNEFVTPDVLADFAAHVGDLLPYLVELAGTVSETPVLPAQSSSQS